MGILFYSLNDADGFKIIWRYFAWCNQTLAIFTLWAITVYMVVERKAYIVALIPALFMTCVCTTYILMAPEGFALSNWLAYIMGGVFTILSLILFIVWYNKRKAYEKI